MAKENNGAKLGFESELWKAADALRSNMDAAEYKHVVLGLIFLKYISDAFEEQHAQLLTELKKGADPEDPDEYRAKNIFWVPKEARWSQLKSKATQPSIGKAVDDAMIAIERDNPSLRGVLPKEYGHPRLALEHMPKHYIALSDWGIADGIESNKFGFKKGEILFGKLRPYFHKVGVGPVDGVCSTDIVVMAPKVMHWFGFVLGHVSSDRFVEYANAGSTGTKMPRTSWTDMARYGLVLPKEPVVELFNKLVQPLVDRIIVGIHESRTLADLRDKLLPKLISGELRVANAEKIVGRYC